MGTNLFLIGKLDFTLWEEVTYEELVRNMLSSQCEVCNFSGDDGVIKIERSMIKKMEKFIKSQASPKRGNEVLRAYEVIENIKVTMDSLNTDVIFIYHN